MTGAVAAVAWADVAVVAAIAFVLSIAGGLVGSGTGVALPGAVAPVVGVTAAVPTIAIAMLFTDIGRLAAFRREIDLRSAAAVLATAAPATVVGAFVYAQLPEAGIAVWVGAFLLASVPLRRWLERRRFRLDRRGLTAVGVGFGLVSGATIGAGMILISALLAAGLRGGAVVAVTSAVFLVVNLLRLGVFGGMALIDAQVALVGIAIGLATLPGAFVARAILARMPLRASVWMMEAVIVAGGLWLLWRAVA